MTISAFITILFLAYVYLLLLTGYILYIIFIIIDVNTIDVNTIINNIIITTIITVIAVVTASTDVLG